MASINKILLAEDDAVLRKLYCHVLDLHGYEVAGAADGFEALILVEEIRFDLLVIDVMMPNMDGLDLCRRMREALGDDIPIVFLTALDDADTLRRCAIAGGDDYLVKEGSPDGLINRVDYWRKQRAGLLESNQIRPSLRETS